MMCRVSLCTAICTYRFPPVLQPSPMLFSSCAPTPTIALLSELKGSSEASLSLFDQHIEKSPLSLDSFCFLISTEGTSRIYFLSLRRGFLRHLESSRESSFSVRPSPVS